MKGPFDHLPLFFVGFLYLNGLGRYLNHHEQYNLLKKTWIIEGVRSKGRPIAVTEREGVRGPKGPLFF